MNVRKTTSEPGPEGHTVVVLSSSVENLALRNPAKARAVSILAGVPKALDAWLAES